MCSLTVEGYLHIDLLKWGRFCAHLKSQFDMGMYEQGFVRSQNVHDLYMKTSHKDSLT